LEECLPKQIDADVVQQRNAPLLLPPLATSRTRLSPCDSLSGAAPGACFADPRSPRPPSGIVRRLLRYCYGVRLLAPVHHTAARLHDAAPWEPMPAGRTLCTCQGLRPRGPFGHSRWHTRPYFLPPSERRPRPEYNFFRGSMTGLCTPYRRFAPILTNCLARLGADAVRNSFIATDFHRLVPAGLPAHSD